MLNVPPLSTIIKIYIVYVLTCHWKYSLKLIFPGEKKIIIIEWDIRNRATPIKGFFYSNAINCKSWVRGLLRGQLNAEAEVQFTVVYVFLHSHFLWNLSVREMTQQKYIVKPSYK